jgi:hypothetical protein
MSLRLAGGSYNASDLVTNKPVRTLDDAGRLKLQGRIPAEDVWIVRLQRSARVYH